MKKPSIKSIIISCVVLGVSICLTIGLLTLLNPAVSRDTTNQQTSPVQSPEELMRRADELVSENKIAEAITKLEDAKRQYQQSGNEPMVQQLEQNIKNLKVVQDNGSASEPRQLEPSILPNSNT